jgi:hypothetical protein
MAIKAAILLIGLCILIAVMGSGCKGSLDSIANYSVEVKGTDSAGLSTFLLDRKMIGTELDVSDHGVARLKFLMRDRIQMGDKIHTLDWDMTIRLPEGMGFKIVRAK